MSTIAIIPARGGSKGLPDKNILHICGKPLLAWSVECARNTKGIDSVWVTSDSQRILDVAEKAGARPIVRPAAISGDRATSESAWLHALDHVEKTVGKIARVVALQATSPLREPHDLENGLRVFETENCDSLFSGAELADFFIWEREPSGALFSANYDFRNRKRRQDVSAQYVENGSFYVFKPEILRTLNNRLGGKIGISLMEIWKTYEIDSKEDFEICETLLEHFIVNKKKQEKPDVESRLL